ncbi:biotin--[acetyl-CoA-carboxylase] ligase [Phycicoccus endophyticus]|uniref:biotin--[biotin carboxyl-carrier protein] ligase n=1 Tax=Phycicoccus endophyticus TaxID=1690220 RepID=A0A7G9R304_9MICO|nr:biotin--[acetyl-CoA-carboxylase] ligase [Phycicoccus endophyticus]NHI20272.1 biotin--[acetyl-CoA-carboxylase] ligase [Phycicoccus endophyticus]QNN49979.1 biotin--[acetyl-CoA-carboxylase] ligase [Phycicoccus endophyticus]GGL29115.1 biotin--[acetyl-CoA-carboxylase] ligase [Phycicoccus endophyticus]
MEDTPQTGSLGAVSVTPGDPWGPVEVRERVGSTNDELRRDPRPWRVLVADVQESGRGRLGRAWTTTPGTALAVSLVVPVPTSGAGWVPLFAGLALHRAVAEVAGVETRLKWPNDVVVPADGERKLAGILCEWTPGGVVVGAGVNVDTPRSGLPLDTATSLRACGAPGVERTALLEAYLHDLAVVLREDHGPFGPSAAGYREACGTVGREVEVHAPDGSLRRGRATGVDAEGRLTVRTDGVTSAVSAGDVVHVRPR